MTLPHSQRPSKRWLRRLLLLLLAAGITAAAFRLGLVPQQFSPFAPLDITAPAPWFLDARLAALKQDRELCAVVLKAPAIEASPVGDQPYRAGCGWKNAVAIRTAGGAKLAVETVTCEMGAALAMWLSQEVQPLALARFGHRVASVQTIGAYTCRNVVGNKMWADFRSQHATANALDISGFTLDDGRSITVKTSWKGQSAESEFMHDVHKRACRYFRVAIGPDFNAAHHDHLHMDRGFLKACK